MNVAIFASAFHPSLGGVEELVRQLAHEYRRNGISAIVITNRWPRKLPSFELYEEIPVYRLAMRVPEFNLRIRAAYWASYPWTRAKMLRILRRHGIDLLHVQCVSSNGYYASIAQQALELPLILTAQGERTMDADRVYEISPFLNDVLRNLLDSATHITACSQNTLDDLETFYGTGFGDRASVVYNGIRTADFRAVKPYAYPRPYILGIGRLVPQKGFDVLIDAFAQSACRSSHDLLIAGEGSERGELERIVQDRGLVNSVHFVGRADRPTATALFAACAFFVLPSRQEPMGIVNLEAMAAGKAVIATRTGGVPEICLDDETALLVPPADVGALATAMSRLAADADLRSRLGEAGKIRSARFGWDAIAAQYVELYQTALARPMKEPTTPAVRPNQVAPMRSAETARL